MSSSDESIYWRGVPITEMYGSQSPWGAPEFRLVVPASNHAVMYHIPSSGREEGVPPKPRTGHDKWDHDFVRMPCSSQSLYPVEDGNGDTHLKKRWTLIESALSRPIRNSEELADAILSYNTKFKPFWKFKALHKLFDDYIEEEESKYFFDVTLPEIAKLALSLPKLVQAPIPLLTQHKNRSISLSQQQVACLLANAFFCTFPRRNTSKRESEYASYPYINFNRLFNARPIDRVMEKLKCICHYFRRVCTKMPVGVITYSRRSVAPDAFPDWASSDKQISSLPLHVDSKTTIEDADGLIQVDFANKFLGGGVLNTGCVQEEIRFIICPELLLSMLFTEMLKPNEAVIIIGCERYSDYSGYGNTFSWSGDFRDATPLDSSGRRRCAVLAVDALPYHNARHEYTPELIARDLTKAWIGFSYDTDAQSRCLQYPGVATGNWGCGAFGGSPHLKALLQLLACTQAGRPMAYYTFGDADLRDQIVGVYNLLARHNVTVGSPHLKALLQLLACTQAGRPMAYYTFGDADLRDQIVGVYNLLARHNVTVGELYNHIMKFTTSDVRVNKLHPYLYQVLEEPGSPILVTQMDTSDIAEPPEKKKPEPVIKEFLNMSPDLFSQGESDHSVSEFKIYMDLNEEAETTDHREKNKSLNSKAPTEHTSRFFDEMQKLDEENITVSTPINRRIDFKVEQSSDNVECDERIQLDMSSDRKKKMGKKITDYFSKKSI